MDLARSGGPARQDESVEETITRLITVACALTAHDAAAHAPRPLFLSSRPLSSERLSGREHLDALRNTSGG